MTLEQRIEALERRCKRLGKTLVGVGTLALFAVVAGTAGWTVAYTGAISPSSITTSSIFLKDKAGKKRLSLHGNSGSLYAKDSAGKTRAALGGTRGVSKSAVSSVGLRSGATENATVVSYAFVNVNDSAGGVEDADWRRRRRGSVGQMAVSEEPLLPQSPGANLTESLFVLRGSDSILNVNDSAGKTRIRLRGSDGSVRGYNKAGIARLVLYGSKGRVVVNDSAGKARVKLVGWDGSVRAYDSAGKGRIWLVGHNGNVRVYDKAGKKRLSLHGNSGSLYAKDSAGKTRVSLDGTTGKVFFTAPNGKTISHP